MAHQQNGRGAEAPVLARGAQATPATLQPPLPGGTQASRCIQVPSSILAPAHQPLSGWSESMQLASQGLVSHVFDKLAKFSTGI